MACFLVGPGLRRASDRGRCPRLCGRRSRTAPRVSEDLLDAVDSAIEDHVENGMTVGIASQSIAFAAIDKIYRLLATKKLMDVVLYLPSKRMKNRADELELQVVDVSSLADVDLAFVNGAEFDEELNFVARGPTASILRPRLVTSRARSVILIGLEEEEKATIGSKISVEISDFGAYHTLRKLLELPALRQVSTTGSLRKKDNVPIRTLDGNRIAELTISSMRTLSSPYMVSQQISDVPGVIAHDLYVEVADKAVLGATDAILERYPNRLSHRVDEVSFTRSEVEERLSSFPNWKVSSDGGLSKLFVSKARVAGRLFAQKVLGLSETMNVNVDIALQGSDLSLSLWTPAIRSRELNFVDEVERTFLEIQMVDTGMIDDSYSGTFRRDPEEDME